MRKNIKILVACEESQAVTKEFRKLGFEAYSCDILLCSGGHPEWHLQQDVTELLKQDWDAIIAFPPCTYLSNAGACRLYPKKGQLDQNRFLKGMEGKEFFMMFYNSDCKYVAIENPTPSKVFEMPKYNQVIQPYQFGHPFSKRTCLWLKGLPELTHTDVINDGIASWVNAGSKNSKGEKRVNIGEKHSSLQRSKTFPGIAKAMAEQWGEFLKTNIQ